MAYPHIETKADYAEFVAAFERGTQGYEIVTSQPRYEISCRHDCPFTGESEEWTQMVTDQEANGVCRWCDQEVAPYDADEDGDYEAGFSYSPCEICNRNLGGSRYHMAMTNPDDSPIIEVKACGDCLYFAEYGHLDDMTMLEIESAT